MRFFKNSERENAKKNWETYQQEKVWQSALPWFYGPASNENVTIAILILQGLVNFFQTMLFKSEELFSDIADTDLKGYIQYYRSVKPRDDFFMNINFYHIINTRYRAMLSKTLELSSKGFSKIDELTGKNKEFISWQAYIKQYKEDNTKLGNNQKRYEYRREMQRYAVEVYIEVLQLLMDVFNGLNKGLKKPETEAISKAFDEIPGFDPEGTEFKSVYLSYKGINNKKAGKKADDIESLFKNSSFVFPFTILFIPNCILHIYYAMGIHMVNQANEFKKSNPLPQPVGPKNEYTESKTQFTNQATKKYSIFDVLHLDEEEISDIYGVRKKDGNPLAAFKIVRNKWLELIRAFHTGKNLSKDPNFDNFSKLLNDIKDICKNEQDFYAYMSPNSVSRYDTDNRIFNYENIDKLLKLPQSKEKDAEKKEAEKASKNEEKPSFVP